MNNDLNILVHHFFNRSNISELPESDIREFLSHHPYSIAGQVLLAKKLQQSGSQELFIGQANASALYVHDPLWIHFLLNENKPSQAVESTGSQIAEQHVEPITDSTDSTENFFVEDISPDIEEEKTSDAEVESENLVSAANLPGKPAIEQTIPEGQVAEPENTSAVDAGEANPAVSFEPFHTVDYFASQGIRLQQAELGKDKLGQQLKSFTEWLRSMKRLPQATMEAQVDPVIEQSINRIAEHSLQEKEVLTEAMAEVWKKQGNTQKAIEIYNKLSLQNPAKSAYFAAKIEQLKS
jgi:hypothetical protein